MATTTLSPALLGIVETVRTQMRMAERVRQSGALTEQEMELVRRLERALSLWWHNAREMAGVLAEEDLTTLALRLEHRERQMRGVRDEAA